jgi:hypothetical protein
LRNNVEVPLDIRGADGIRGTFGVGDLTAEADANGKATIEVPEPFVRALAKPVVAAVLAERGGMTGSTRRFLTPPRTLHLPE